MHENENITVCQYPLNQIYFYLTDICNLRCRHCWIEPHYLSCQNKAAGLDIDLFQSILVQATDLGLTSIKLTGGEPLLHPEIERIIQIIREKNIGLTVETNGTLCTPELTAQFADLSEVFVSVSLDGADADTHDWIRGEKGCFDSALDGIRNLVHYGIRPQIIMTIMNRNKDQMFALVQLAETLGAGSVKFNILQPTARGAHLHGTGGSPDIEEMISLGRWVDDDLSRKSTIPLIFHQPPAFRGLGKMFRPTTGDGCQSCGIMGILGVMADGSYALCGIGATVPELIFGHAARDSLKDVWEKNPIVQDIRKGLPQRLSGVCSRCLMKKVCLGGCLAQNYYRRRSLWAPFWYCDEAFQKGLFPETRLSPV
ncbi:MAG: SynChlorMet cassette radical SAM/SPASM protein ScmF [Syntrophales bacterium]|nr:SynChlorMet cassette radical SAM/SPASM protein ScmF [Syntrophales bacterium]